MNPFEAPKTDCRPEPITKTARHLPHRLAAKAAAGFAETVGLVVLLVFGALVAMSISGRI